MTAKDYLSRVGTIRWEADRLEEKVREAYARATGSTRQLRHAPSRCGRDYDGALTDYTQRSAEFEQCATRLLLAELETFREIDRIPDARFRILLRARYLEWMTWEKVGEVIGCCYGRTLQLHKESLQAFAEVCPKCDDR